MKLICDCGNKLDFIIEDKDNIDEFGCVYAVKEGNIVISSEHDQAWIDCKRCGKSIYIFT